MQGRGGEVVSQLAVWHGAAERGRFVPGSVERQDRVQPAVTDSAPVHLREVVARQGRNRVLFVMIAVLSLAGVIVSAVSLATSLCEVGDCVLRFQPEVQLRHREPQRVFDRRRGFRSLRSELLATRRCLFWRHSGESRAETPNRLLGAAIAGLAFALIPDLHRSLRTDDLVHFMPGVAGADFSDQCLLAIVSEKLRSARALVARASRCILIVHFP